MSTGWTIADADGDIAALVYPVEDRPDLILCAFAGLLMDAGLRVCGLVQLRDPHREGSPGRVMVLDRWQVVDVGRPDGARGDCRLDAQWLDQMGAQAEASIRRGVDIVIVNRFGPLEAHGRGFRNAIRAASQTATPLVIAVPTFAFEGWTRFSSGMTVRLDCSLDSLLGWWNRIAKPEPPIVATGPRAGELTK